MGEDMLSFLVQIHVHCVKLEHWMTAMELIGARVGGTK